MLTQQEINNIIAVQLSKLPIENDQTLEFLIGKIFEWVQPELQQDSLLLETVLEILVSKFSSLVPVDEFHAEQLKKNVRRFLNRDADFEKKIKEKIEKLKHDSGSSLESIKQSLKILVNSHKKIVFIKDKDKKLLIDSGLGVYERNGFLVVNDFYANHHLLQKFLQESVWIAWINKLIFPNINISLLNLYGLLILSAFGGFFIHSLLTKPQIAKPLIDLDKISALCDNKKNKQYKGRNNQSLDISCGDKDANDSSYSIYRNNQIVRKQIESKKLSLDQVYPITTVVPLSSPSNQAKKVAHDMLKAVADVQADYNQKNQSKALFVIVADDSNNTETGQDIAEQLGQKAKIVLGVIGSYSSSNSVAAIPTYRKHNLVLISPTATATIKAFNDSYQKFFSKDRLDFSFFFRPIGTTSEQIKDTLQYLNKNNYKRIGIFLDDSDTYPRSLKEELEKQNKTLSVAFKQELRDIDLPTSELDKFFNNFLKVNLPKDKNPQDSTAILIFQGALKDLGKQGVNKNLDKKDNEVKPTDKAQAIMRANQGHFLVVGSNTVYQADLMCNFSSESAITGNLNKLLIMQPWFPERDNLLFPFPINCDKENLVDRFSPWTYAMTYDATQMLIWAIEKASEGGKKYPSRENIQTALMSNDIQNIDCPDQGKGIKDNTLTGIISLHVSDRCNPSSELIKPEYLKETNEWQWVKLPKP